MAGNARSIQTLVDELAAELNRAVLVDDQELTALFWSAQQEVDPVRMTSILRNTLEPAALELVSKIKKARTVVVTEAIAEIGMQPRVCAPLIHENEHIGFLWVLDPQSNLTTVQMRRVREFADQVSDLLAKSSDDRDRRRAELIARLERIADDEAAAALAALEGLPPDICVVADLSKQANDWLLYDGIAVRPVAASDKPATSGAPLPLRQLGEVVRRARLVRLAIKAGARLDVPNFAALQSWRLLLEAPLDLQPSDLQPNFDSLLLPENSELLNTAAVHLLEGGDIAATAEKLHVHRTTLYYRLGRISDLLGVNFQSDEDRFNLRNALLLYRIRQVLHL